MATLVSLAQGAHWDVLFYLFAILLAWGARWKVKTSPDVERVTLGLRVCWGLIAGVLGLIFLRLIRYAVGTGHVHWLIELVMTASIVLAVIFITEPYANFLVLRMPRHVEFDLAERWRRFVDQRSLLDSLTQAKLLVLLFENDPKSQITVETSFQSYMNLLCAATHRAQQESFATFVWDVENVGEITLAAKNYFDALANSRLSISRVVIGSEEQIATVDQNHMIYRATKGHGGKLYKVSTEKLLTKGLTNAPDFAIFDGTLVVKGAEKPKKGKTTGASAGISDPSSSGAKPTNNPHGKIDVRKDRFIVSLLRGQAAAHQRSWTDQLHSLIQNGVVQEV